MDRYVVKVLSFSALLALLAILIQLYAAGNTWVKSAAAADEASVLVTVTPSLLSITLTTDGMVNYGSVLLGETADTTSGGINDSQTVQNNGSVVVDVMARGTDSAAWTLAGTSGANQYVHKFCTSNCDVTPVWSTLTTSNQILANALAASASQTFDLQVEMPSSTASSAQQSINVELTAIAD